MKKNKNIYTVLIFRIFILVFLFSITRILFYIFNLNLFQQLSYSHLSRIMLAGIRFDLTSIFILNIIFIILFTIPLQFRYNKIYQKIYNYLYIISNSFFLLLNCIDIIYFRFTLKRTTADVFGMLGKGNDVINLIPRFIIDFWYIFLIWILLILALIFFQKIFVINDSKTNLNSAKEKNKYYFSQTIWFLISIFISVIAIRGGFQLRPTSIITAGQYTTTQNIPLVLNTPFTIIKTLNSNEISEVKYFDENTALSIYNPCIQFNNKKSFNNVNVVIFILESFSKEYSGFLNPYLDNKKYKGYTPFLDSLMKESLTFTNAFANGRTSMEAIPAVISSIPTLTTEPFITGKFSGNKINSLATLLKKKGYISSFFHGGTNGTMGFDDFIFASGFDNYFGRKEYNNEKDYDGHWGIFDEEFLQYTSNKISQFHKPFLSVIFTLSSHHPYTIPAKYLKKFPKEKMPITACIRYSDYSLKRFFETASKTDWYKNTIFIFTADHTFEAMHPQYNTRVGSYEVTIIFFKPNSNLKGICTQTVQQIDIMPSLLDYMNYSDPFFSFGKSVFDSNCTHYAVSYLNDVYQIIQNNFALQFDGKKTSGFYNFKKDNLLENNLMNSNIKDKKKMEDFLKAYIQTFNERMIKNQMHCK